MRRGNTLKLAWLGALAWGAVAEARAASLSGTVSAAAAPLPRANVYAYELADASLLRVATDEAGAFRFETLPAGLYKIVAFKAGFVPAIALLTRASAEAAQVLDMELEPSPPVPAEADFWAVRRHIPPDVLRDIETAAALAAWSQEGPELAALSGEMEALAGVDRTLEGGAAQMTGGRVDLEGAIRDLRFGVAGDYIALESASDLPNGPDGRSQAVTIDVEDGGTQRLRVTSLEGRLRDVSLDPVDFETHRVAWSRQDDEAVASVAAQYTAESNYYRRSSLGTLWLPEASRAWRLEGSYARALGERSRLEAGVRYRELETELADDRFWLPQQRVEVFGRNGLRLNPTFLVEYGVFSTLRDGSLSLMPQGSLVVQLGPDWRARAQASVEAHDDPIDSVLLRDFAIAQYDDYASCEGAAEHCYQVLFSRFEGEEERFSIGGLHRRFDETLRLHFDPDFFNQQEHLYLVPGDTVPELQMSVAGRPRPRVLTRLRSSLGSGGGGVVWVGPRARPYENQVTYLVTSLDTQFQATDTGVFLAFHHLSQRLDPLGEQGVERLVELHRLQLLLTQELDFLHAMASDFAVHLNMEVSRGLTAVSEEVVNDPDELRSRITGGFAVSF